VLDEYIIAAGLIYASAIIKGQTHVCPYMIYD